MAKSKNEKSDQEEPSGALTQVREMVGIVMVLSALFVFLSLIFHNPADIGSAVHTGDAQITNKTGKVGAIISRELLFYTGYGAYVFTGLILFIGSMIFLRIRISSLFQKTLALVIFMCAGLTFAALMTPENFHEQGARTMVGYGGVYGQFLMDQLLPRVGRIGAHICTFIAFLLSLLLGTRMLMYPYVKKILQVAKRELTNLKPALSSGKSALAKGVQLFVKLLLLPIRGVGLVGALVGKGVKVGVLKTKSGVKDIIEQRQEMYEKLLEDREAQKQRNRKESTASSESSATHTQPSDQASAGSTTTSKPTQTKTKQSQEQTTKPKPEETSSTSSTTHPEQQTPSRGSNGTTKSSDSGDSSGDTSEQDNRSILVPNAEEDYELPPLSLLNETEDDPSSKNKELIEKNKGVIQETLNNFGIEGEVVNSSSGPVITMYEVELAPGVQVSKLISRSDDLAIALKAASVRIVYPIPGKSTVGIEVPNAYQGIVRVRELWEEVGSKANDYRIPLMLGRSAEGDPVHMDLADMPHLLIAGTTGSGKSVCLKNILVGQLLCRTPQELKLLMVDPKMVELTRFEGIPHLICPIIKNMKKVSQAFEWLVDYMEERYKLLQLTNCTDLDEYNALDDEEARERLEKNGKDPDMYPGYQPRIIAVVDELGDLMSVSSKEVETTVTRIAQKARAVGIHMILSTQRPSSDVITGLIKSNMPARVSFKVMSGVNSRIIIDQNGAEDLIGDGDMLLSLPDREQPIRSQGALIEEDEIESVCEFWKDQAGELRNDSLPEIPSVEDGMSAKEKEMKENLEEEQEDADDSEEESEEDGASEVDEKFEDAVDVVVQADRGSVSLIQRKLQIGYTRAARIMEQMAEEGLVGPHRGNKPRKVLIDEDEWRNLKENGQML